MADGEYVDFNIWIYEPSKAAAIAFAVAFSATGAIHAWQAVHFHSWRLTGLYVFCSFLFVGGFIARALGSYDNRNIIKYIVSIVLTYAAPPLYELGNYYILGRILYFVPHCSPIHPGRVLTTFAAISTLIEALNGVAASYVANVTLPKHLQDTGHTLFKVALILQLVVIFLFVTLATTFYWRCRKNGINHTKVNQPLVTLYISSTIIFARTIYRTVEYFEIETTVTFTGSERLPESPILRYEWYFYVFEAALMLINNILLNVRHPRQWLPQSTKLYLAKDGITEILGPGYKEDRGFVATLLDPFDVYGMIKGRDKTTRFWDEQNEPPASHNLLPVSKHPREEPSQV
ncbi:RTA1 like protein-domain-containing protein [Xylaria bambusicola]|uniref:RTA1 like protein-domain-containing protein n=1 Tax=Xylaria bambusicola TaxID=326684 RepID=UPI0020076A92|nr:RTA1 like protein-domain-containing protein [Xylaria bambusicola]KAI0503325.1 RTA1 like protein-domain-containing protein [Xylaria bambusicola]